MLRPQISAIFARPAPSKRSLANTTLRWLPPHSKSSGGAALDAPNAFDYLMVSCHYSPSQRGHSLMVKFQPSKLAMRVRFPLPAIDLEKSTRDFARRNRAPSKSLGPR